MRALSDDRAGTDWLVPEATSGRRARSWQAKLRILGTAGALFVSGLIAWLASGAQPRGAQPLSFFLAEQAPNVTGIDFVHQMGAFAPFFDNVLPFMRAVSASACTADVDGDGDLDVYFTTAGDGQKNALYLNDGNWKFHRADVPALDGDNGKDGFSSDCVFADIDNDGFPDLFVGTVSQRPHLFHNDAGVGFHEVSAEAGIPDY